MNEEPKFKIGDRVARGITAPRSLSIVVGYRRGVIVGVAVNRMHTLMKTSYWYTVLWDKTTDPDGGHHESGLLPESALGAIPPTISY